MDEEKRKKHILTIVFKAAVALAALGFIAYTVYFFATIGKQVDKIKDKYEVVSFDEKD